MRMFDSVLFPAPFSPSSACTSPAAASKSTESFASTPGKRFVMPRIETAGETPEAPASLPAGTEIGARCPTGLGWRDFGDGPDYSLHQRLDGVQVLDGEPLAGWDHQLAALVIEGACELEELAALDRLLPGQDRRFRLRGDPGAERRELREAVLDRSVVE